MVLPPGAVILGPADPVVKWQEPWEFEAWKTAVLRGKYAGDGMLAHLYSQQWEPDACYEHMLYRNLFKAAPKVRAKPKPRVVEYDSKYVELRLAQAYWKECNRLLLRNLNVDARALVEQRKAMAENSMAQFRT